MNIYAKVRNARFAEISELVGDRIPSASKKGEAQQKPCGKEEEIERVRDRGLPALDKVGTQQEHNGIARKIDLPDLEKVVVAWPLFPDAMKHGNTGYDKCCCGKKSRTAREID